MIMLLALAAWTATWLSIALRLRKNPVKTPGTGLLHFFWVLALVLHCAAIALPWMEQHSLRVDFLSMLSIVLWLTGLLLFLTNLTRPLETLGLFILPFMLPAMLVSAWLHHDGSAITLHTGLGVHIFLSLLAYSMLTLAAIQALLLALQNRQLHQHKPGGLIRTLPPLQDMESLLFKLIFLGVLLLSFGLISGFVYLDGFLGKHVAHKTILSIAAWIIYATLLLSHWRYGWRGRTAIRWTLSGFTLLLLAFLGSKFIYEYVVGQS